MAFTVKAVELYQILDDVLVGLYLTSTREEELESKLTHILEIDGKIKAWKRFLPDHLQIQSTGKGDAISDRQATDLWIRLVGQPFILSLKKMKLLELAI